MGGGLAKDPGGRWRTTNFNEGDNFATTGDYVRVVAASILAKEKPDAVIIVMGGKGQYQDIPDAPPVADVLKQELMILNISPDDIIEERKSGTTYQQLRILPQLIVKHNLQNVMIVSNRWHLPRMKAMIEYASGLQDLKNIWEAGGLVLVAAEDVLVKYDPKKWQETIKTAYESLAIKARIALEEKGVEQIKAGTYQFR